MALTNNNLMVSVESHEQTNSYYSNFLKYTGAGLGAAKPVFVIMFVYLILGFAYLSYFDRTSDIHAMVYLQKFIPQLVFFFPAILLLVGVLGAIRRGKNRWFFAIKRLFVPRNLANFCVGALILTTLCVFMAMFTAIKNSFADLQGFQHDLWQANLDKFLFFGNDPWRILFQPIHNTLLQQIVEINYNVFWHVQVFTIIAFVAYTDFRIRMRIRYLVSISLVWIIIGTLFAGLFISAGPAFYGLVTGDDARFGEQLAALAQYNDSTAIKFQAYLWRAYQTNSPNFGTGISAFPSIHVSLVSLNVFFAFEISRKLGIFALIYAIFVGISSVYLAWHYAIDGIIGAMIVAVIYYTARALMVNKPKQQKQML